MPVTYLVFPYKHIHALFLCKILAHPNAESYLALTGICQIGVLFVLQVTVHFPVRSYVYLESV